MALPLVAPLFVEAAELYAARVAAINAAARAPVVIQAAERFVQAEAPPVLRTAIQRAIPGAAPFIVPNPFNRPAPAIETPTVNVRTGPIEFSRPEIERAIREGRAVDPFAPGTPRTFGEQSRPTIEIRPILNPWTGTVIRGFPKAAPRISPEARRAAREATTSEPEIPALEPLAPVPNPFAPPPARISFPEPFSRPSGGLRDLTKVLRQPELRIKTSPEAKTHRKCTCETVEGPRPRPRRRCARWVST